MRLGGSGLLPYARALPQPRGSAPMARITVEDCIEKVPNRFHLVQMASIRTKQIKKGARALVGSEGNKEVVVALREIAAGLIKPDYPNDENPDTLTA